MTHTDLCGPTRTRGLNGDRYFMILIDDYFRMTWITFIREKYEARDKFKCFNYMIENEMDTKIKFSRFDIGHEFALNELNVL